jgi:outer membrane protein assembly factor BamB
MAQLRALALALALGLPLGCRPQEPRNDDPRCTADGDCPKGQHCAAGACVLPAPDAVVSEATVGPARRPELIWDFSTGAAVTGRPLVVDGDEPTVFVANHAGRVLALDSRAVSKRRVRFEVLLDGIVWGHPARDAAGRLWVGADDDTLYGIDPDGAIAVRLRLGDCQPPRAVGPEGTRCDVDGGPTLLGDGDLLVGADGVYRIGHDGAIRWHAAGGAGTRARHVFSSPAAAGELVVFGGYDGNVTAVSIAGEPRWTFAVGADVDGSPVVGPGGDVYIGADDGKLYALSSTGALRWAWTTKGEIRSAVSLAGDGTIYVASADGTVTALDPTGKRRWSFAARGPVVSAPTIDRNGTLYFGSQDDTLYALAPDGSQRWALEFPGDIDAPVAITADGSLIVACDDGVVRALAAKPSTR